MILKRIHPAWRVSRVGAFAALLVAIMAGWPSDANAAHLRYGWQAADGVNLFYREGGRADAPTIVFLHGNPSSSIQYEEVMENLLDRGDVHVLSVDYPSFGYSEAPDRAAYDSVHARLRGAGRVPSD